jgi:Domain of unknown function (DUF4276)
MTRQIFVGLIAEGTTDHRFLKSIIERTFQKIKFECANDFEVMDIQEINVSKGISFVEKILQASKSGFNNFSMMILCIHSDADATDNIAAYRDRIAPALEELDKKDERYFCKIVTPIVPIQTIEAWMLADKELFKRQINTKKTDTDLGIYRKPEEIASPKEVIENAIRIARAELTQKRRVDLTISNLYLPIGQSIDLEILENLSSYQDFKNNVRKAFRKLNLLQE